LWASQLALCGATFGSLFRLRDGDLGLDASKLLGAVALLLRTLRFDARSFGGCCFLSGRGFGCGLSRGGLLFGGGLNVGGFAASTDRCFGGDDGSGGRLGHGVRATTTRRRSGHCRAFRAHALFALPARANASHLVVAEHAHMAANRDVHLPKQTDDLIGRNPEFVRQLADCELAQTSSPILLARGGLGATSSRTPAANCRSVIPTTAV
jgi:hypothetical protein